MSALPHHKFPEFIATKREAETVGRSPAMLNNLGAIDGNNDRVGGWQLMYQMLARGPWLIAGTCPQLIGTIPSRVDGPKQPRDLLKAGGDSLDDLMDSARYGLYSFIAITEKPVEVRRAEIAGQFAGRLQDPELPNSERAAIATSAMIWHAQLTAEEYGTGRPIRVARSRR